MGAFVAAITVMAKLWFPFKRFLGGQKCRAGRCSLLLVGERFVKAANILFPEWQARELNSFNDFDGWAVWVCVCEKMGEIINNFNIGIPTR